MGSQRVRQRLSDWTELIDNAFLCISSSLCFCLLSTYAHTHTPANFIAVNSVLFCVYFVWPMNLGHCHALFSYFGSHSWFWMEIYGHLGRESGGHDWQYLFVLSRMSVFLISSKWVGLIWMRPITNGVESKTGYHVNVDGHHLPCGFSFMKANMYANCCLFYYVSRKQRNLQGSKLQWIFIN